MSQQHRQLEMTLTPIREGQLLPTTQQFKGDFAHLTFKATELLSKIKLLHPDHVCAIMIEDLKCQDTYYFMDGQYYDNQHKKIEIAPISLYDYGLN